MQRTILEMVDSTFSTDALDTLKVEHAVAVDSEDAGTATGVLTAGATSTAVPAGLVAGLRRAPTLPAPVNSLVRAPTIVLAPSEQAVFELRHLRTGEHFPLMGDDCLTVGSAKPGSELPGASVEVNSTNGVSSVHCSVTVLPPVSDTPQQFLVQHRSATAGITTVVIRNGVAIGTLRAALEDTFVAIEHDTVALNTL